VLLVGMWNGAAPSGNILALPQKTGQNYPITQYILVLLLPLTNYYKLGDLKQYKIITLQFSRSEIQSKGNNQGLGRVVFFLNSGEHPFPCFFQLPEAAYSHWLVAPFHAEGQQWLDKQFSHCITQTDF
jgi:hypothetical protein